MPQPPARSDGTEKRKVLLNTSKRDNCRKLGGVQYKICEFRRLQARMSIKRGSAHQGVRHADLAHDVALGGCGVARRQDASAM